MNREIRTMKPCEMRAEGSESEPLIEGYFAVFDEEYQIFPDMYERISPKAFSDDDLTGDVRCLIDHDTRLVLGRTTAGTLELRTDDHGLYGKVKINPEDSEAMNLYQRVKRGDVNQCSFGFDILGEEYENREDGTTHWVLNSVKLYEVSCCTFPAYETTSIEARNRKSHGDALDEWKKKMKGMLNKC